MWGKTWLFLVRERGSLLEEEVGSLTSGSKQGLESFKGKGNTGSFLSQIPMFNLTAT